MLMDPWSLFTYIKFATDLRVRVAWNSQGVGGVGRVVGESNTSHLGCLIKKHIMWNSCFSLECLLAILVSGHKVRVRMLVSQYKFTDQNPKDSFSNNNFCLAEGDGGRAANSVCVALRTSISELAPHPLVCLLLLWALFPRYITK